MQAAFDTNDGKFVNNEFIDVYLVTVKDEIPVGVLTLQESEVAAVRQTPICLNRTLCPARSCLLLAAVRKLLALKCCNDKRMRDAHEASCCLCSQSSRPNMKVHMTLVLLSLMQVHCHRRLGKGLQIK